MKKIEIKIESLAKNIAKVTPVVIKCNETFRYLFVPYLLDNAKDKSKNIKAQIIVQKKNISEKWEDFDTLYLNKLRSGDWFKVDISSSELDIILAYCNELKDLYSENGKYDVFNSNRILILNDSMTSEEIENVINILQNNKEAKEIINKIIEQKISPGIISKFLNNDTNDFSTIIDELENKTKDNLYNELKIKMLNLDVLRENLDNDQEKFWQDLFKQNPNILFSIIPSVFQLICDQPYVGGKSVDNKNGLVGDYLFKSGTNNVSIIEIKTPKSKLITPRSYRENVFAPSMDLAGSIVQIRKQKDKFIKNYYGSKNESMEHGLTYSGYDPKCYIVIGDASKLDEMELQSFELFRNELKDIEVITFDELINKIELIQNVLRG